MQHVFVYGTLLFPDILKGLTGNTFEDRDAVLYGFKCLALKDADYPAIIAHAGSSVQGKVLFNVDERSLEILRFFEGDEYNCITVKVNVDNNRVQASAFVWTGGHHRLDTADWDQAVFEKTALADYISYVVPETVKEFEQLYS